MKKNIFFSVMLLFANITLAQDFQGQVNLSPFGIGILGGINTTNYTGTSFLVEGRINLIPNLNSKISIGYSTIYEKDGTHVDSYNFIDIEGFNPYYVTGSYDIERFRYSTVPISLGLEYILLRDIFTPYTTFEVGYNFYEYKTEEKNVISGNGGYHDNYEDIPELYKNDPPKINKDDESFRIGFGIGTLYKLSSKFFLDLRYGYQINTSLVNTHQFLIGIQI